MKKVLLVFIFVLLLTGCFSNNKFYLEDKYYIDTKYIEVDIDEYNKIKDESFILFTYNSYCQFAIPCQDVFKEAMEKYKISIVSMPYAEFKKTNLHDKVKYAPSVIIVKKGKIIDYLDSESDSDIDLYQNADKFSDWLKKYIYLEKN